MNDFDQRPASQRLADLLLDGGLDEFVRTRRASGQSWRQIEHALVKATDGKVSVSGQTIKTWYGDAAANGQVA